MLQYTFYPTASNLSNYISTYACGSLAEGKTDMLHAPPNGFCGFIINIIRDEHGKIVATDYQHNSFAYQSNYVVGQTTQLSTGYIQGKIVFLVVFFKPLGLYHFFGTDMQTLSNKTVDLHDFLGTDIATVLINDLKTSNTIEAQINCLNNFFSQIKSTYDVSYAQPAVDYIDAAHGNINVKDMEEKLSINRRKLERYFKIQVGISPKVYAQICRFKYTLQFLQANPTATWAHIAFESGFSDQPHLIKYFQEYLKVSPNNFVKLDNDFINYLLHNYVY